MGFNIGSIVSDIGSAFKSFDIGNIGKSVLDEGKKLLGDVVKDTFQLSSQPGKTFDENLDLNILGNNIQLPNPVDALANKLLGKANDFLNQYGVNVDFKTALGKLFHLSTQGADGSSTDVTVPSLQDRMASLDVPGAAAVGGGAAQVTASYAAPSVAAGAAAVGGGVSSGATPSVVNSGDNGLLNAASKAADAQSSLMSQIENLNPDDKDYQKNLLILQTKMQAAAEAFQMISQMEQLRHQTASNTIGNIR